jgi:uncharacterized protein YjiS (DUF1127 family)
MSICEEAPASAIAGRGSFVSNFRPATLLERVGNLISSWRNRRLVVSMRDFDDAQLADIGLTRGDVESALKMPSLDPTQHLIVARRNPLRGARHS